MTLATQSGDQLDKALESLFKILKARLDSKSAKPLAEGARDAIRAHFQTLHPGSSHYSPKKVNVSVSSAGNTGIADVNVPGASRAYHDIDIRPKAKQSLTIPLHQEAFGKKATDFNNLFVVKTNAGKEFLAMNNGGDLQMMYLLSKHVHQKKDSSIMPSDNTIANEQFGRLARLIDDVIDRGISTI